MKRWKHVKIVRLCCSYCQQNGKQQGNLPLVQFRSDHILFQDSYATVGLVVKHFKLRKA